jgi:predicted SnoaL-like aldol condensation-catalyzing enzyme
MNRWIMFSALILTGCAVGSGVIPTGQDTCTISREVSTGSSGSAPSHAPIANRDIVLAFYREGLVGREPRKAFERYVSPNFIEHKPEVEGGTRDATAAFLEQLIKTLPGARWEIIRTVAEGEFVFLQARFSPSPGAPPYAVADLFRLSGCLIVEHWDIVGRPPERQRNPNPRF